MNPYNDPNYGSQGYNPYPQQGYIPDPYNQVDYVDPYGGGMNSGVVDEVIIDPYANQDMYNQVDYVDPNAYGGGYNSGAIDPYNQVDIIDNNVYGGGFNSGVIDPYNQVDFVDPNAYGGGMNSGVVEEVIDPYGNPEIVEYRPEHHHHERW